MILITHIISAVIGTIGSYIWTIRAYKNLETQFGKILTFIGLVGVVVSGIFLFEKNPATFLESGKFLSNMTVMILLIGIEISSLIFKDQKKYLISRLISTFSWSWIFIVALLNPPFAYWVFMVGYVCVLGITFLVYSRKFL